MVEEEIAARYSNQMMRCPTHLSTGQEAVPAAIVQTLRHTDYAISTHRGHAHYLGKGGSLKRMIAEIYGRATGCSAGRGGSMHLIDLEVGFMGTSAIVGNSIPIGVGFGLSIDRDSRSDISCVFLGDGATEEGVFYESLNFAAVQRLPVLFLVENNLYSVYSGLEVRRPKEFSLCETSCAMGVAASSHDGNNPVEVLESLTKAVEKIRKNGGPRLLEYSVYRWREHCGPNFDNDIGYRTEAEYQQWKMKEPVATLRKELSDEYPDIDHREAAMISEIMVEVNEAFEFAEASPFPDADECFMGEFNE